MLATVALTNLIHEMTSMMNAARDQGLPTVDDEVLHMVTLDR